ncbi:hypothetical protein [uncultured Acetobacteroides sp.]|uniref:hypothetical protein n=1 Tax=uncultured Acetobacteroides sp. TaxID=1760811 RepID=UPI0029F59CDD|nr:hypothetical protein [uncultured Acetobacteroides sp.]
MTLKHIFALLLVGTALVGIRQEAAGLPSSTEEDSQKKQQIQDLSSLATLNRMLALTDFKITSKNLSDKDRERANAEIEHLVVYFFKDSHNSTLYEEMIGYTVDKDSRFWSSEKDTPIVEYENEVRVLRAQAIFAIWKCTTRDSLLSEIEAYNKRRSQLFLSASASNQAHDIKVSEPSWHRLQQKEAIG